jgi:hypothetical protein
MAASANPGFQGRLRHLPSAGSASGRPTQAVGEGIPADQTGRSMRHPQRPRWNQDQKATGTSARDRPRRSRPTGHRCIAGQPPTPCRLPDEVEAGRCRRQLALGGRCAIGHNPSDSQVGRLVTARRSCATQDGCSCLGSSAVDPCCCARWRSGVGVLVRVTDRRSRCVAPGV